MKRYETSGVSTSHTVRTHIELLDLVLLSPQAAPECEFEPVAQSGIEPGEAMRMKLDYQQQCYRQAEEILRARFQRLQEAFRKALDAGPSAPPRGAAPGAKNEPASDPGALRRKASR
jgi:hypothetical protein